MIQEDWFFFIRQYLTGDQIEGLSQPDPLARRKYVLSELGSPISSDSSDSTPNLAERLKVMIRDSPEFWRSRRGVTGQPSKATTYRLLVDGAYTSHAPSDLRRLGIFFDEVLYPCPIHEVSSLYTERGFAVNQHNLAVLGLRLGGLLASADLLESTKPAPVFNLAPVSVDVDAIIKGSHDHSLHLIQSLLMHVEASSLGTLKASIAQLPENMLAQLVRDEKMLDEMMQRMQKQFETSGVSEVIGEAPDGSLKIESMAQVNPSSWGVRERLYHVAFILPELVRSADTNALIAKQVAADILHASTVGSYLAPLQDSTLKAFERADLEPPEELLVARGLLAPESGYLESTSAEALAKLRQDLEGIRREITVSRAELREALHRGEREAVSLFTSRLGRTIDEAGSRIADAENRRKVKRTKVLTAAGGTLSLTAASTLFPLVGLPALGVATTALGLFWGTGLLDAWREMSAAKRDLKDLAESPLSLLASYGKDKNG